MIDTIFTLLCKPAVSVSAAIFFFLSQSVNVSAAVIAYRAEATIDVAEVYYSSGVPVDPGLEAQFDSFLGKILAVEFSYENDPLLNPAVFSGPGYQGYMAQSVVVSIDGIEFGNGEAYLKINSNDRSFAGDQGVDGFDLVFSSFQSSNSIGGVPSSIEAATLSVWELPGDPDNVIISETSLPLMLPSPSLFSYQSLGLGFGETLVDPITGALFAEQGFTSFSMVSPVPVPAAAWLFSSAMSVLMGCRYYQNSKHRK